VVHLSLNHRSNLFLIQPQSLQWGRASASQSDESDK